MNFMNYRAASSPPAQEQTPQSLQSLYENDETAWLDVMSEIARSGRTEQLDLGNLAEYLKDMARRDRREVEHRLVVLLSHLLKWNHQPERRSRSWRHTIVEQRQELNDDAGRGVLRNHAESKLGEAYLKAMERASAETGLPAEQFPSECPYTLDQLLNVSVGE